MSSSLIIALEFTGVIGVVLGLAVWELLRLRRDRKGDVQAHGESRSPREP